MKCKYCGGNLGLEDAFCPHCGKPNELAQKHVQDMQKYSGEFAETRENVYKTTRRFSGVAVRLIILAVLIVATFVMFLLANNAGTIVRDEKERVARKNADAYQEKIDEMIMEGDYRELADFVKANYINFWIHEYDAYMRIFDAAKMYSYAVQHMMEAQIPGDSTNVLNQIGYFADTLPEFYRVTDPEGADAEVDLPQTEQIIADMEENLNVLMKVYLGLTEEEIEAQKTMTNAKRTVFFQEKYEALHSGGAEDGTDGEEKDDEE